MQHIFSGSGAPSSTPAKVGHHYIDILNGRSYISTGTSSSSDWKLQNTPTTYVIQFNGRSGNVAPQSGDYTAAQVGADPTGTATAEIATHVGLSDPHTQYALESTIGAVNGICPLGSDQKVPAVNLPSYVDDVLEYANLAALPITGESGKIYITLNDGLQYRWSGSAYVQIVGSPGTTDSVPEGSTNLYFTNARAIAVSPQGVLTGVDLATPGDVIATDTIIQAIGKLYANTLFWTELVTASDLTNSSNTTVTNVTALSIPVTAGKKYRIELTFMFRSTATTTGIAITMGATGGAVGTLAATARMATGADGTTAIYEGAITAIGDLVISTNTPGANIDYIGKIEGVYLCTTSGSIHPQFRSETNGQTITFRTGSCMFSREF